jgi:heterodisulfide reductase subunit A-like polyferredoxin
MFDLRCDRCRRQLGWGEVALEDDPDPELDRLLCRHCWTVLVLCPEKREATA